MKSEQRRELYSVVFNTPEGEKVLKDIGRMAQVDHSSFSTDHAKMSYNEGQKELYRRIRKQLEAK